MNEIRVRVVGSRCATARTGDRGTSGFRACFLARWKGLGMACGSVDGRHQEPEALLGHHDYAKRSRPLSR
jgi:hypothetical protein